MTVKNEDNMDKDLESTQDSTPEAKIEDDTVVSENAVEGSLSDELSEDDSDIVDETVPSKEAESDAPTAVEAVAADEEANSSESVSALKRSRSRSRKAKILVPIGLFAIGAIGAGYVTMNSTVVPTAAEINENGSKESLCEPFLTSFDSCTVNLVADNDTPRDALVSQSVDSGYKLNAPDSIELVYSAGPDSVEFPNLIRKNYEDAVKELYSSGLEVGEVTVTDKADLEPNRIVSASVATGEVVKNGTAINLEISSETVEVPDLIGKTKEQAELDLEKIEVTPIFTDQVSDKPQGTVISQTPAAGNIAKGSKVEIGIAKPEEVTNIKVPSVVGKKEDEAQGIIAAAGFKNIAVVKVEGYKVTEPLVTHVVPGEGRSIRSDSNIVIIVSVPPAE